MSKIHSLNFLQFKNPPQAEQSCRFQRAVAILTWCQLLWRPPSMDVAFGGGSGNYHTLLLRPLRRLAKLAATTFPDTTTTS